VVGEIFGHVLTKNEVKIIDQNRTEAKGSDPELTDDLRRKLAVALK
jgi:hypothetical protein